MCWGKMRHLFCISTIIFNLKFLGYVLTVLYILMWLSLILVSNSGSRLVEKIRATPKQNHPLPDVFTSFCLEVT